MALSASSTLLHLVLEAFVHTHAIDLGKHGAREIVDWNQTPFSSKQQAYITFFPLIPIFLKRPAYIM